jgi:hypothetical protein
MSRAIHRLSAGFVSSKKLDLGVYHDGGGLYLQVRNGGRSWLLRYMLDGRARHMGLGRATDISLSEARHIASDERKKIAKRIDPIKLRKDIRNEARTAEASMVTFEQAAKEFLEYKKAE